MKNVTLKLGEFYTVKKALGMPVILVAYGGTPALGQVNIICTLGFGNGATSYNLLVAVNQPFFVGAGKVITMKVTGVSNNSFEITIEMED